MSIHDGHRQRLIHRFQTHGLDTFEEHEVLELLLFFAIHRKDTNPIAHDLIRRFGSLAGVLDATEKDLREVDGIGEKAALLLQLAKPLCRRYMLSQTKDIKQLNSTALCADHLRPFFFGMKEEHVFLLCLDAGCHPICCREISEGNGLFADLPIQKAAKLALESRAVSVVLAHNHPCGDATASQEDYRATTLFRDAMQAIGVAFVDHIIFGTDRHISLLETGYLNMA